MSFFSPRNILYTHTFLHPQCQFTVNLYDIEYSNVYLNTFWWLHNHLWLILLPIDPCRFLPSACVLVTTRLCSGEDLYMGVSGSSIVHQQLLQNAAACLNELKEVWGYCAGISFCRSLGWPSALERFQKTRLKLRGDWALSVTAPKLWNELPLHMRQASSLSDFKTSFKTHLLPLNFNTT